MPRKGTSILVAGDVVLDAHIYAGGRQTPDSSSALGTRRREARGGAVLLHDILSQGGKRAAETDQVPGSFTTQLAVDEPTEDRFPSDRTSYAVWKPFPRVPGSAEHVWRIEQALGYGPPAESSPQTVSSTGTDANPDIVVIDDGALGFRLSTSAESWPATVRKSSESKLEWIVLKMSSPICEGDLWREVSRNLGQKTVAVVSIDDIRREEVRVARAISWERAALDLVRELNTHPTLQELLRCAHVVINLGTDGALHVDNSGNGEPQYRLIYDARHMEGDWRHTIDGDVIGLMSCLTAGIACHVGLGEPDIQRGIKAGLCAMRRLRLAGHGDVKSEGPGFPFAEIADAILKPHAVYGAVDVPAKESPDSRWTILQGNHPVTGAENPLCGVARRVALIGPKALARIPYAEFGKLFTVDRQEIERLRILHHLIHDYVRNDPGEKPLSIAVFGPPGSGKSFGVKQIAKSTLGDVPILEFNLSQFSGPEDLIGALHQVRDKVLEGTTPFVFWDEFDSREYMWLQYLLAPMEDGRFREGQITHPIGKCVFVFAGGTSYDMESFGPPESDEEAYREFRMAKGTDFKSRLSGYLNVLGPNQRQYYDAERGDRVRDPEDTCFPVRRALLVRAGLGVFGDERLQIDRGVLSALLEVDHYKHGARSLVKVVGQMKRDGRQGTFGRSDLPPAEILSMHLDLPSFEAALNRDVEFTVSAGDLAPHVHEYWRDLGKKSGWHMEYDMPFAELPEEIKDDNRAAAARIPQVLELVGLYVVPKAAPGTASAAVVDNIIESNIEILAEAEHDGWMDHKKKNGWVYSEDRNDDKKRHNAMIPYNELYEYDREKDRNAVRKYPELLARAGYECSPTS
jgi:hypothetical protein